ncbi:MAG: hypothetical protein NW214_10225 [Pseudanabaenaceae cyanobacterium bins.39]|nr:hypothetical protein [Pseudanabaenaceae cyanobacterium bins.39]
MTIISKKQVFLAASAIAAMAGVALSMPNAVSAARLATYDFEFKFANNTKGVGYITVDKDYAIKTIRSGSYGIDASDWYRNQWIDFSFAYLGATYTKADARYNSFLSLTSFPTSSNYYYQYGSYAKFITVYKTDNTVLFDGVDSEKYDTGNVLGNYTNSFSLTERKAVPVPALTFGIVAAGGWIASKQLRRKTKAVKQEVSV